MPQTCPELDQPPGLGIPSRSESIQGFGHPDTTKGKLAFPEHVSCDHSDLKLSMVWIPPRSRRRSPWLHNTAGWPSLEPAITGGSGQPKPEQSDSGRAPPARDNLGQAPSPVLWSTPLPPSALTMQPLLRASGGSSVPQGPRSSAQDLEPSA